jgi:hypothetical protein
MSMAKTTSMPQARRLLDEALEFFGKGEYTEAVKKIGQSGRKSIYEIAEKKMIRLHTEIAFDYFYAFIAFLFDQTKTPKDSNTFSVGMVALET